MSVGKTPLGLQDSPWVVRSSQSVGVRVPRLKIMVVEDDALIGMLLGDMLEGMGHDVCAIVATEDGAVSGAAFHHPDLMVVDAWLGEGSGISAMDKIQTVGPMPHVFVSGDKSRVRIRRPDSIMVQKPYREADIVQAIRRAYGGHQIRAPQRRPVHNADDAEL